MLKYAVWSIKDFSIVFLYKNKFNNYFEICFIFLLRKTLFTMSVSICL